MLQVGAGWALARVPRDVGKTLAHFDPLLRWLLLDGYGFHEAFFHPERVLGGRPHPRRVQGYAQRAFDQGIGRAMWFASGANVRAIAAAITEFPAERRPDLWSGVGLASTYAGEASDADLETLVESAGTHRPQLAQGAAFAAKTRLRAGNVSPYTVAACRAICEVSVEEAAEVTDRCLEDLPSDAAQPSYEIWRQRIQQHFSPILVT